MCDGESVSVCQWGFLPFVAVVPVKGLKMHIIVNSMENQSCQPFALLLLSFGKAVHKRSSQTKYMQRAACMSVCMYRYKSFIFWHKYYNLLSVDCGALNPVSLWKRFMLYNKSLYFNLRNVYVVMLLQCLLNIFLGLSIFNSTEALIRVLWMISEPQFSFFFFFK